MKALLSGRLPLPALLTGSLLIAGCALPKADGKKAPGDAASQVRLGDRCFYGTWLAGSDPEKAVAWYRKAAQQGDARGLTRLGLCYAYGDGVAKNHAEALALFRKAAEQGDSEAQYRLGRCYAKGDWLPKNPILAYKWLNLAAGAGNEPAKEERDDLAWNMSASQIAKAQRLSLEWKPQ